jgi:hypothetical protein
MSKFRARDFEQAEQELSLTSSLQAIESSCMRTNCWLAAGLAVIAVFAVMF